MVGGISDYTETFVLTHIFVQRNQQQLRWLAWSLMERLSNSHTQSWLLEGGCGWLPDLAHSFHEHWEKRIRDLTRSIPIAPP